MYDQNVRIVRVTSGHHSHGASSLRFLGASLVAFAHAPAFSMHHAAVTANASSDTQRCPLFAIPESSHVAAFIS
jgi:hypothetical protein